MKTITCSTLGGPCDAKMTAATPDEMIAKGVEHVKAAHPEMAADMAKMSPEEMKKWHDDFFMPKWNAASEDATAAVA